MSFISKIFGNKKLPNFRGLVDNGAQIIDVRTPQEYDEGHIRQSRNIPLHILPERIDIIKSWDKPIIAICKSGARSARAKSILKKAGVEVYNGGAWQRFQSKIK